MISCQRASFPRMCASRPGSSVGGRATSSLGRRRDKAADMMKWLRATEISVLVSEQAHKMTAAHACGRGLRICSGSCVRRSIRNLESPMQPKLSNQMEAWTPSFYFVADSGARGLLNKQENYRATRSDGYRAPPMA